MNAVRIIRLFLAGSGVKKVWPPSRAARLKGTTCKMRLSLHKTRIVATIGPASSSPEVLREMILAGMNVARLNFSHGEFATHQRNIQNIRAAAQATKHRVAIMADLSGPKMRIGRFASEPIKLKAGEPFTLTTDEIVGDQGRVSVSFDRLPEVV